MFTIRFLLPTLLMVCIPNFASAQTEPARPIYVKEFQINRFVDATRFVQKAVMANTAEGHYILEFTARYGETRERWTVTYENDPAFDFVQRVQMNSDWRYTIKCAGMVNDPRLTISVPRPHCRTLAAERDDGQRPSAIPAQRDTNRQ